MGSSSAFTNYNLLMKSSIYCKSKLLDCKYSRIQSASDYRTEFCTQQAPRGAKSSQRAK